MYTPTVIVKIIYQHKKLIAKGQNFPKCALLMKKSRRPTQKRANPAKVTYSGIELRYLDISPKRNKEEKLRHSSNFAACKGIFIKNSPIRKKGKIIASEKSQYIKPFFKEIGSTNI